MSDIVIDLVVEEAPTIQLVVETPTEIELVIDSDGLSAYQIALIHGFVGTEAQWLASLQGEDGGSTIGFVATEDIAKYDPVTTDGKVADSSNILQRSKFSGIATVDALTGFVGQVQTLGILHNDDWTWLSGEPIFVNGTELSNIAPVSGWLQRVGTALGDGDLQIKVYDTILL